MSRIKYKLAMDVGCHEVTLEDGYLTIWRNPYEESPKFAYDDIDNLIDALHLIKCDHEVSDQTLMALKKALSDDNGGNIVR